MKDFSTLNLEKLTRLPVAVLPHTYRLQDDPGNGCAGDPPGYPSYFTRSVYTRHGGNPPRGPATVITIPATVISVTVADGASIDYVVETADESYEQRVKRLSALWKPLPIDHPRTRAWIIGSYIHQHSCYWDEGGLVEPHQGGKPTFMVYPVPSYKLKHFHDDERFSKEWRKGEIASVELYNRELNERAAKLAVPENHLTVRTIRKFYPEYQPELDLIDAPPKGRPGDWWERFSRQPSPEECSLWAPHFLKPHKAGWCQFCGRGGRAENK